MKRGGYIALRQMNRYHLRHAARYRFDVFGYGLDEGLVRLPNSEIADSNRSKERGQRKEGAGKARECASWLEAQPGGKVVRLCVRDGIERRSQPHVEHEFTAK